MKRKAFVLLLAATPLAFGLAASAPATDPSTTPATLIRDVRIFDGDAVIEHGSVLVRGGLIAAVGKRIVPPPGAEVIDGAGKTLLPGLIDGHVHVSDSAKVAGPLALEQAALYGVTTMLEMGTADPVTYRGFKSDLKAGKYPLAADLFTAGVPATVPNGHGDPRHLNPTLTRPEQADGWVADRVKDGSDYIKIMQETFGEHGRNIPTLDDATIQAIVVAAHKRGKLTVAHTLEQFRAKNVISDGVDGLAHISPYNPPDADFGTFMKAHHAFQSTNLISYAPPAFKAALAADPDLRPLMPGYMIDGLEHARPFPDAHHDYSMAALKLLVKAGVPIIAGTDIGYPYAPLLHAELAIMTQDGGMSPIAALRAATSTPASIYHLADRGRIAKGLRADLLLMAGDPTRDILATRHIVRVWLHGRTVDRDAIRALVMAAPAPPPMGPPPAPPAR